MHETVEKHIPTGPKDQICYTQGGRRGFSLSDWYKVKAFLRKALSCHADTDEAQGNADAL